ncbi:unnamed protein product, partial [Rotaria sp. Silwood2]
MPKIHGYAYGYLELTNAGSILNDLRSHQNASLENAIHIQIQNFQLIYNTLQATYDMWIQNLEKYRQICSLLKLFSNREIMILIILLRTSNAQNSIRNHFLNTLFSFKDLN